MGGQLNFRNFAYYPSEAKEGTLPLQPPFVVTYILTQCSTVEEVVNALNNKVTILAMSMLGVIPIIHWAFTDRAGETIIIESDEQGLQIYRNSMGVMINSPNYPWYRVNLLNYVDVRNMDYDSLEINGDKLEQCFSGNGDIGLSGDCSSSSRFIRL